MYFFPMKNMAPGHGHWHQDQLLFQRSLWATARRKKAHSVPAMCLVRPANQKLLGAAGRPGAKSKVDAYQVFSQIARTGWLAKVEEMKEKVKSEDLGEVRWEE